MESIIGFVIFAAVACGMGYLVYTRIMARKAKDEQRRADRAALAPAPTAEPVSPNPTTKSSP
jgi:hypothetical protein